MAVLLLERTVGRLREWAEPARERAIADDELLQRFAAGRDEAAFAELVRRHGGLVLGVARRVVGDSHSAEDVLQSTFLLLARKANVVRWHGSVAPWLHAAAYRLACDARRRQARQPVALGEAAICAAEAPPDRPLLWDEVRAAVDEELARLPTSLSAPLVLCYLQGRTRDEAAQRLGWTLATLKRRLERGRRRLRDRLARRGLSPLPMLALPAAEPSLPADLVQTIVCSTTQPACWLGGKIRKLAAVAVVLAISLCGGWFALKTDPRALPADAPPAKPAPRLDAVGDPLPEGAVARLGTVRLRPGLLVAGVAFSPDGQRLAVWTRAWSVNTGDRLIISDVATGRELRTVDLPRCHLMRMTWLPDGRGLAVVQLSRNDYFVWEFTDENVPLPVRPTIDLDRFMRGDVTYEAIAISPDGRRLVTGRSSPFDPGPQPIEVWDVKPNAELKSLQPRELGRLPGNGLHLLFSADGKRVFVVSRQQDPPRPAAAGAVGPVPPATLGEMANRSRLTVFEIDSGKTLADFPIPALQPPMQGGAAVPTKLALSPDGRTLYIGDETSIIHVFDWAAGKELVSFVGHPGDGPNTLRPNGVQALAIHPDGRTLYSAGRSSGLSVWDLQAKPPSRKVYQSQSNINQIMLSPDASRIAVADAGVVGLVEVLDAKTGESVVAQRPGHAGIVLGAALLPDGAVMTAGLDRSVRTWDISTGREIRRRPVDQLRDWLSKRPFTTDGRGLFAYENGQVVHVDLASGKSTRVATEVVKPVMVVYGVSGTSVFVNTPEGQVRQWDAATGRTVREFDPPHKPDGSSCGAVQVSLSPDGRQVVMLSTAWIMSGQFGYRMGSFISFYDAASAKLLKRWYTKEADFQCCTYSPDGRYLVAAGMNSFSGAGVTVTEPTLPVSPQSGPVLFDARTGEPIRAFEAPVTVAMMGAQGPTGERVHRITALTISPNGALFAAAQMDGSVSVHELATGALCRRYTGHRSEVSQLLFTSDGRRLISVSHDMTGLVWDTSLAALAKPGDATGDRLWIDLAKPEWELAGPAVSALAGRPDDLLKLARVQMKPAAGPDVDAQAIMQLSARLGDSTFAVRERASAELARLGRDAIPLLQGQLALASTAEQRQRLQQAIQAITRSPVPSEELRRLRMLALLEQQGTAEARAELERLAAGFADAALTREAQAALRRVGK